MKGILLALAFFASGAFGATRLLEKTAVSGFIQPEFSFSKKCVFYNEGYVHVTLREGLNPPHSYRRKLRPTTILRLRVLLESAKKGKLVDEGVLCDAGTRTLFGYLQGRNILLRDERDCVSNTVNHAPVVPYIDYIATGFCGF